METPEIPSFKPQDINKLLGKLTGSELQVAKNILALRERIQILASSESDADFDESLKISDAIADFGKSVKSKYPDTHQQYLAYHLLVGSSPMEGSPITQFDFPAPDSVEGFIQRILPKAH